MNTPGQDWWGYEVLRRPTEMHRALLLALWSNDYEIANTFFRTCAEYLTTREPMETCVAITRHPLASLDDTIKDIRGCTVDEAAWGDLPWPVGFMLRAASVT